MLPRRARLAAAPLLLLLATALAAPAAAGTAPRAPGGPVAPGAPAPVRVLALQLDDGGAVTVLGSRRTTSPPTQPAPDQSTAPVQLQLASGRTLQQRAIVSSTVRSELPARPGSTRLSHDRFAVPEPTASLVLPAGVRATGLTLRYAGRTYRATDLSAARAAGGAKPRVVQIPGYDRGPATNRIDLVVLGDGYQRSELGAFRTDAATLARKIVRTSPFSDYRDFLNVVGVFAPSQQSGADQPPYVAGCDDHSPAPTCCPEQSTNPAQSVDTRYDSTFCSYGIQRNVGPADQARVEQDATRAYPRWDQLILLVNDDEYGGSGGGIATTTTNPQGAQVIPHELGHSLLRLDDEYTDETPGYPPCSDRGRDGISDPCRANITDDASSADDVKWSRWVISGTPVPTESEMPPSVVGAFLGGHYDPDTYYRPCDNCLMRALEQPMGAVESEELPLRMFDAEGFAIHLVEPGTVEPATGAVRVRDGGKVTFRAGVLSTRPQPGTEVTWSVDGNQVAYDVVGTGPVRYRFTGDGHAHTVSVTVQSRPGVLHPVDVGVTTDVLTWKVRP